MQCGIAVRYTPFPIAFCRRHPCDGRVLCHQLLRRCGGREAGPHDQGIADVDAACRRPCVLAADDRACGGPGGGDDGHPFNQDSSPPICQAPDARRHQCGAQVRGDYRDRASHPAQPDVRACALCHFQSPTLWLFVVFISGISFVGYVLIKVAGAKKGIGLTGLLGGMASSTAVTASFTAKSHERADLAKPFALAITVA